jgi:hypothetical protein
MRKITQRTTYRSHSHPLSSTCGLLPGSELTLPRRKSFTDERIVLSGVTEAISSTAASPGQSLESSDDPEVILALEDVRGLQIVGLST